MASRAASTACAVPRRSRWMNVAASGRRRLISSATAPWSGPMTTASAAPASFGAAPKHMRQQRLAGHRMQDLGRRGAHARALTGREHDGQAGSSGHPNPCNGGRCSRRRRHKAFSPRMETRFAPGTPGKSRRIQDRGTFPVNVCRVIRAGPQGGQRRMARDTDHLAGRFDTENTGGLLNGFLAEEDVFDRRALWRLGSWGAGAVGAVILAVLASQSSMALRREQVARPTDLAASPVGRQGKPERGPAAGIRHRHAQWRSRPAVLPRHRAGTGAGFGDRGDCQAKRDRGIAAGRSHPSGDVRAAGGGTKSGPDPGGVRRGHDGGETSRKDRRQPPVEATVAAQDPATISPVEKGGSNTPAATPATSLMAAKSMMAPPDAAAAKLIEPEKPAKDIIAAPMPEVVAYASPADEAGTDAPQAASSGVAVQRTEFGVDVGGANSLAGLRALWRGLLKSRSNAALTTLRPIIVIKEGRERARHAAAAGRRSAQRRRGGGENLRRPDRKRASMRDVGVRRSTPRHEGRRAGGAARPAAAKPSANRRSVPRRGANVEPGKKPDSLPPCRHSSAGDSAAQ